MLGLLAGFALSLACDGTSTSQYPSCEKGEQNCGCIADMFCFDELVCADGVCRPIADSGSTMTGTTDTTGGDATTSATTSGTTASSNGTTTTTGTQSTSSGESSSSTGSMGQPEDGQYSDCFDMGGAGGQNLTCLEIDPGGRVMDAVCSANDCNNPQQDCDPAPGGTAEPTCLMLPNDESYCVLSCAGGADCPEGMSCYEIGLGIEICA